MATSKDTSSSPGTQHSLRCSVCLDDFKDPKVLPCCHTFCKQCLEKISSVQSSTEGLDSKELSTAGQQSDTVHLAEKEKVVLLTCPQCRAQHEFNGGGVDTLLTDYAIKEELDKLQSSLQEEDTKLGLQCGLCESTDPAVNYCNDCFFPLCEFCHKAHQRLKQYNGHNVKSINEINTKLLSRGSTQRHVGHLICSKHPTQVPQIFCNSCDELVCCKCVVEGHQGHVFAEINSETRHEMEKKLSNMSSTVHTVLEVFEKNLKYVETVEKVTNDTGAKVQADIKKMFDEFISILQRRRDDLLAKSEDKNNAKLKVVWSEKDFLERTIAKLTTTLSFSERLQICTNDGEFLSLASQALVNLKELEGSSWDCKTVEEIDVRYLRLERKANEPVVFQTAAKFDERRNQRLKLEWNKFPAQVNLGVKHKGTICVTRDDTQHSYVLYNKPLVIIHHQLSPNCHVADVRVDRSTNQSGAWDITFTPYCGGHHICVVAEDITDVLLKSFGVVGVPPLGSKIMRGPSWSYHTEHNYGASKTEVGIVTHHVANEQRIGVEWPDGKGFQYRWGNSGMFEVQLYH